jgi:hypothetical protein
MIESLARRVIVLLVLLMILPTAFVVIGGIFTQALSVHAPGEVGVVGGLVLALLSILFTVGLIVRITHARHDWNTTGGRMRDRDARFEQTAVRVPAGGVPLDREQIEPEDPDPTLPLGGE